MEKNEPFLGLEVIKAMLLLAIPPLVVSMLVDHLYKDLHVSGIYIFIVSSAVFFIGCIWWYKKSSGCVVIRDDEHHLAYFIPLAVSFFMSMRIVI